MISICLPVGPEAKHQRYLAECFTSIAAQTMKPFETVIVDDMANVDKLLVQEMVERPRIYENPWRMGIPASFNTGVAIAPTECVVMLGADDTLSPDCIEKCWYAYNHAKYPNDTYFYLGVKYMDTGEEQFLPCNAAMVTKQLWRLNGGFPPASASGSCDAVLGSIMLAHSEAGLMRCVDEEHTLYNYRRHPETDTAGLGPWQGVILETRDLLTREWKHPQWGRFE